MKMDVIMIIMDSLQDGLYYIQEMRSMNIIMIKKDFMFQQTLKMKIQLMKEMIRKLMIKKKQYRKKKMMWRLLIKIVESFCLGI